MAAVVQGSGMKPLQNGTLAHLEMNKLGGAVGHEIAQVETDNYCIKESVQEIEEPEIDIVINNVVCSFSVKCHLNLRQIALTGRHVEYRRENGVSEQNY